MSSTPSVHASSYPAEPVRLTRGAAIEPAAAPLSLVGWECSLDTVPLDGLEAVARSTPRAAVARWFDRLDGTEEAVLLGTCHRVELLVLLSDADDQDRWRRTLPGPATAWRAREGREVARHLFRVATGRESLAVGELEVSQQVRAAGFQVLTRHPRPVLRELLFGAASAAQDLARDHPPVQSIASVAVRELRARLSRPSPRVLVVGSGTVGRQVAQALSPHAEVTLVFHSRPPSEAFLRSVGADAVRMDRLKEAAASTDAIVTAAKFGNHGLGPADLPRDHPLVLVDLGMPRNVDPAVRDLSNVRLVDLEELHRLARTLPAAVSEDDPVRDLADRFYGRVERWLFEPWIDALFREAETLRRSEVEKARRYLGPLDAEQEVAIERLTRQLVAGLLVPPTERIRSLPPGPSGDLERRLAVELLRPAAADP